jgi:L-fuconolactonase
VRIDSHNHFWKFDPVRDAWINEDMHVIRRDFLPGDLLPLLKQNGFDGTIAVQADQSETETEFLISLATENDFIKGVVGWVDLQSPNLLARLDYFQGFKKLKGFRHIVQGEPAGFLSNPEFAKGVKALGDYGFTYDLLIYHYQLKEALTFVARLPEVNIVLDHIAKPSIRSKEKTSWELQIAALSTFENVYCKLSGMVTEANWKRWTKDDFYPYLDEVLESFGPSRLMYGSDWPVCLVAATYEQQLRIVKDYISALSPGEQDAILGNNAVKFYKV